MQELLIDYGDSKMRIDLPDSAVVVRYGKTYQDPPACDSLEATRRALQKPAGFPPLAEMASPSKKIVIAFPDRVKGGVKVIVPDDAVAAEFRDIAKDKVWPEFIGKTIDKNYVELIQSRVGEPEKGPWFK